MYRCQICSAVSQPKESRKVWTLYKPLYGTRQIDREIPVCKECMSALQQGKDYTQLVLDYQSGRIFEAESLVERFNKPEPVKGQVFGQPV